MELGRRETYKNQNSPAAGDRELSFYRPSCKRACGYEKEQPCCGFLSCRIKTGGGHGQWERGYFSTYSVTTLPRKKKVS